MACYFVFLAALDTQSCDLPDVASSVTVVPVSTVYTNGSVVNYSCNIPNHGLLGKASSTCITGKWSPDPGECYGEFDHQGSIGK